MKISYDLVKRMIENLSYFFPELTLYEVIDADYLIRFTPYRILVLLFYMIGLFTALSAFINGKQHTLVFNLINIISIYSCTYSI